MSKRNRRLARSWLTAALLCLLAGTDVSAGTDGGVHIRADDSSIQYSGRRDGIGSDTVRLGWSGARARLRFKGSSSVGVRVTDRSGENYAMVWIDGKPGRKFRLDSTDGYYVLADGLDGGEHTIEFVRVTECFLGLTDFKGFTLEAGGEALPWVDAGDRKIEFIGDSITCGYGVESDDPQRPFEPATENFCLAYSGLTARALEADYLVVARSGIGMVRNYDGPREGNDDAMPRVYPETFYLGDGKVWDSELFVPDVVCLNLGTNDFSTSGVDVAKFVTTYADFLRMLLSRYPDAKIVVIQGPMENRVNLRNALYDAMGRVDRDDSKRVHFISLTPQGPVGHGADYHPNREQSKINAAELTSFLAGLMGWR